MLLPPTRIKANSPGVQKKMANALTLGEYYFGLNNSHTKGKGLSQHLKDKFMTL